MHMGTRLVAATATIALTLAFAGTTAGSQTNRTGMIEALTYNVAGLPEPLSGSEPATNTVLISPLLNDYEMVLVQEDWVDPIPPVPPFDFYHDDLISQVTHPYVSTPALPPIGTDPTRPTALIADGLNRLSRFPFGDITRVRWTNCFGGADTSDGGAADCLAQKGFSVARTTFAEGVVVDVYNLHGEAGSTPLDVQYSAEDYVLLAAFMADYSAGRPIIVGGDFNLHTDEEPDATVYDIFLDATGLTDTCEVVDCGDDADEIDKFAFRSGAAIELAALTHQFERDKFQRSDGEPLSDHSALAVTFQWTAPALPTEPTTSTSTAAANTPAVRPAFTG
jgi:hypothetical protein